MSQFSDSKIMRRVAGYHDIRLDGMLDLVIRAREASVLDIGCNRGLVGFEMANNGAKVVHGVDIDPDCIKVAQHLFADLRNCESLFRVVDLTAGSQGMLAEFRAEYDIVLMLATYHKLKRIMEPGALTELMHYFGRLTQRYFGWRGTSDKPDENEAEAAALDRDLGAVGLRRVHTSYISTELGMAAVWGR